MAFFEAGYKVPEKPSKYIKPSKLPIGDSKFRILSSAITGYVWFENSKPIRVKTFKEAVNGSSPDYKHFWEFVVWNYQTKSIQIMQVTQPSIQKDIEKYVKDEDYGDPQNYDIVITKEGEGINSRYKTTPKPPKPMAQEIEDAYGQTPIDLSALYRGEDPFKKPESFEKEVEDSLA